MPIVKSEIAGSVWKIEVASGQLVGAGEVLMILESMKMEIPIEAPAPGRVTQVLVKEGDSVGEEQALLWLEPI